MDSFDEMHKRNRKRRTRRVLLGLAGFLLFLCLIVAIVYCNRTQINLDLNGPEELTLEYGAPYTEPGANASLSGLYLFRNRKTLPLKTVGQFDPYVLGEQSIEYSVGIWKFRKTVSRKIRVVDTVSPTIMLNGSAETYVLPGKEYLEEGFVATDNCDGDLTDAVVCTAGEDCIVYYVEDKSGNSAEVKRTLIYADRTPPDLLLTGSDSITIRVGADFEDPGYEALDDLDGDISDQVTVEGEIDVFSPGSYVLRYCVEDSSGNASAAFRTVTVEAAEPIETIEPAGKVIYLTFDDGPSCHTEKLLEILGKYNVKATFFVVNTEYADLITEIAAQGHSIGIHSASHDYRKIYSSEEHFVQDLKKMQRIIKDKTGHETFIMRFPGGRSNTVSSFNSGIMTRLTGLVSDMGFQYFDWNVDSRDASDAKNSGQVAQNVISAIKGQRVSVVLQHDSKEFSVNAVEKIIQWGQENGYTFLPLSLDSPCAHHGLNN